MGPERTYFYKKSEPASDDRLDGKFYYVSEHRDDHGSPAHPLKAVAGKYWWVEVDRGFRLDIRSSPPEIVAWTDEGEHQTMSTAEIAQALDSGFRVRAYGGPYETWDESSRRMDLYWDAMI